MKRWPKYVSKWGLMHLFWIANRLIALMATHYGTYTPHLMTAMSLII